MAPPSDRVLDELVALRESVGHLHVAVARYDERSSSAITQLSSSQKRTSDRVAKLEENSQQALMHAEKRSEERDEFIAGAVRTLSVDHARRLDNLSELVESLARQELVRRTQFKTILSVGAGLSALVGGLAGLAVELFK